MLKGFDGPVKTLDEKHQECVAQITTHLEHRKVSFSSCTYRFPWHQDNFFHVFKFLTVEDKESIMTLNRGFHILTKRIWRSRIEDLCTQISICTHTEIMPQALKCCKKKVSTYCTCCNSFSCESHMHHTVDYSRWIKCRCPQKKKECFVCHSSVFMCDNKLGTAYECSACGKMYCGGCMRSVAKKICRPCNMEPYCYTCRKFSWDNDFTHCSKCGETICPKDTYKCCSVTLCINCSIGCDECETRSCTDCAEDCDACGSSTCRSCSIVCDCGHRIHNRCASFCEHGIVCAGCGVEHCGVFWCAQCVTPAVDCATTDVDCVTTDVSEIVRCPVCST